MNLRNLIFTFLILILSACSQDSKVVELLELNTIQLKELLQTHKRDVVVLHYWATWCRSCKEDLESLSKLEKKYSAKGFKVIAVSVDPYTKNLKKVREFYSDSGGFFINAISTESNTKSIMTILDDDWKGFVPISYVVFFDHSNVRVIKPFSGGRSYPALEQYVGRVFDYYR